MQPMTRVILGSASPGRLKVLRQAGIDPLVVVSGVDEDLVAAGLEPGASPARRGLRVGQGQGPAGGGRPGSTIAADCVVVGCDSMLYLDGRLWGKPPSVADARLLWQSMAGRAGELYTGHCVIRLLDNEINSL